MAVTDAHGQICLPPALSHVSQLIESKPEAFLEGDQGTRAAALNATKYVFDLSLQREKRARPPIAHLLHSVVQPSTVPETRSRKKRKRSPTPPPPSPQTDEDMWHPTPLESLHLEGMDDDQVWAQLELRAAALCDTLKVLLDESMGDGIGDEDEDESVEIQEGDLEHSEDSDELDDDLDDSEDTEDAEEDAEEEEGLEEEVMDLRDTSDDEPSGDEDSFDLDRPTRPPLKRAKGRDGAVPGKHDGGHPVLDDGFFSLTAFNAEIEEVEAKNVSEGRLGQDTDDDDDVAEDDFDLFTALDEVGADTFEEDDLEVGGEPYYKDFFAPPSHHSFSAKQPNGKELFPSKREKASRVRFHDEVRVKKIKSRGKGNSVAAMKRAMLEAENDRDGLAEESDDKGEDSSEVQSGQLDGGEPDIVEGGEGSRRTIERFKDDLFAEDEEAPPRGKTLYLSTHEARQAEIAAQIAELEMKSVAPKEWTLMGEATSRARPVNSLLEEDLDFERVMKVVPVVTEERVSSIEGIIKGRILESRFDDVMRKRPVDDKAFLPSRMFELNDQKSTHSLAQIYEDEFSTAASGKAGVDDRDGKLRKEHEELEKMWDSICHKLDALSNAHFTPKQPKATISTVSNLPTAILESALPTTKSVTTMLAPEEIFAATSDTRSRGELTPKEKRMQRNKQRKARRKVKDRLATSVDKFARSHKAKVSAGNAKKEKEKALQSIVKVGKGVTVIGKSTGVKRQDKRRAQDPLLTNGKKFKL